MSIEKQFWDSSDIDRPTLTDEMVSFAENILNVKLPKLFIDLLKIQNGGQTKGFAFPMSERTSWNENHVPLFELFGIITPNSIIDWQKTWNEKRLIDFYSEGKPIHIGENILDTPYMTKEWGLPEKQVLLTGEGHWWITLDYRKSEIPTIRWIDVECNEDIHIAHNFEEFIKNLVPEDNYIDENEN